ITKAELKRTKQIVEDIYKKFRSLDAKGKSDVKTLVNETRQILARAFSAGPKIQGDLENESLQKLIDTIPFRTRALNTSLRQFSEMTASDKEEWFDTLRGNTESLQKLIDLTPWMPFGDGDQASGRETSEDELFSFLAMDELP